MTSIEWTDKTWSPVIGCSRVSPGCTNCYAERFVHRGLRPEHKGLTVLREHGPGWTGEVRFLPERLSLPSQWTKPRRIFVNPMSDLFHEKLSMRDVARVFAVMAEASRHTFQILTKRPRRMRDLLSSRLFWTDVDEAWCSHFSRDRTEAQHDAIANRFLADGLLPNVWLGVTAEDQQRADERIPVLLDTPAALRFVSYEPALGPVDLKLPRGSWARDLRVSGASLIDWVIVGGESGPGARPFAVEWAGRVIHQCSAAGVPVFVKQLGALTVTEERPGLERGTWGWSYPKWRDRKGGDMSEWTGELERLRVRQFPEVRS